MPLSVIYGILFYFATILFVVGVARKIYIYAKTPAPLKIPTTPAPLTKPGVAWRIFKEVTVFQSLFKSNMDMVIWLVIPCRSVIGVITPSTLFH